MARIVGRMVQPGSERRTGTWLHIVSVPGEMLGVDFGALSEMALYLNSDQLIRHPDAIKRHLFDRAMSLISLTPTVAFYDLANTCF